MRSGEFVARDEAVRGEGERMGEVARMPEVVRRDEAVGS